MKVHDTFEQRVVAPEPFQIQLRSIPLTKSFASAAQEAPELPNRTERQLLVGVGPRIRIGDASFGPPCRGCFDLVTERSGSDAGLVSGANRSPGRSELSTSIGRTCSQIFPRKLERIDDRFPLGRSVSLIPATHSASETICGETGSVCRSRRQCPLKKRRSRFRRTQELPARVARRA